MTDEAMPTNKVKMSFSGNQNAEVGLKPGRNEAGCAASTRGGIRKRVSYAVR